MKLPSQKKQNTSKRTKFGRKKDTVRLSLTEKKIERQVATLKFYSEPDSMSEEKKVKMGFTPLTNSACESNFGDLTYDITRSAGSNTKMKTFSNKNIIRKIKSSKQQNGKT